MSSNQHQEPPRYSWPPCHPPAPLPAPLSALLLLPVVVFFRSPCSKQMWDFCPPASLCVKILNLLRNITSRHTFRLLFLSVHFLSPPPSDRFMAKTLFSVGSWTHHNRTGQLLSGPTPLIFFKGILSTCGIMTTFLCLCLSVATWGPLCDSGVGSTGKKSFKSCFMI